MKIVHSLSMVLKRFFFHTRGSLPFAGMTSSEAGVALSEIKAVFFTTAIHSINTKLLLLTLIPLTLHPSALTPNELHRAAQTHKEIKLESSVLKMVDGTFINADTVELMRKFQRKLIEIQFGERDKSGQRTGRYRWNGAAYSVHDLHRYEADLTSNKTTHTREQAQQFTKLLHDAKEDFMKIAGEFRVAARGSKPLMAPLVKESCERRNRHDSILLSWSRCKDTEEDELFTKMVTNFAQYETFCVDLLNFLGDLVRSCSKAHEQFQERVQKWSKIKTLMPAVLTNDLRARETEFCLYVKQNHLDKLTLAQITPEKLKAIAASFRG